MGTLVVLVLFLDGRLLAALPIAVLSDTLVVREVELVAAMQPQGRRSADTRITVPEEPMELDAET